MPFKFPKPADLAKGAIGDIIQGRSLGDTVAGVASKGSGLLIGSGFNQAQRGLDKSIQKLSKATGLNLGNTRVERIFDNPQGALEDVFGTDNLGKPTGIGGWFPRLQQRPDPVFDIDWIPELPLGLPAEYVEEVQFSLPRFSASQGIPHNGSPVFIVESREVGPVSITFYEDNLLTVTNWLTVWQQQISPDGIRFNYQSAYKFPIRLYQTDAIGRVVGQYVFYGTFPTSFPQISLLSESSTRIKLVAEFSCDSIAFQSTVSGALPTLSGPFSIKTALQRKATDLARNAFSGITSSLQPSFDAVRDRFVGAINTAQTGLRNIFS